MIEFHMQEYFAWVMMNKMRQRRSGSVVTVNENLELSNTWSQKAAAQRPAENEVIAKKWSSHLPVLTDRRLFSAPCAQRKAGIFHIIEGGYQHTERQQSERPSA